jgi:hypothetical protein
MKKSLKTSKSSWRASLLTLPVIILTSPLLGACAHNPPAREPVTRQIPGPPDYLRPEPVPSTYDRSGKGKSPFIVAEERGQVIVRQNVVITAARGAWTDMKATYNKSFLKRNIFGR